MRRIIRNVFIMFMAVVLCFTSEFCGARAEALSVNAKALKAYKKLLAKNEKEPFCRFFALIDLNKDGVMELVYGDDSRDPYHSSLLAYVNGKVKAVGGGFSGDEKYYPNKHLYYTSTFHTGVEEHSYYKFTGKKLVKLAEKYGNESINAVTGKPKTKKDKKKYKSLFAPYKYTVRGKTVSKKKYESYVKNLKKGAKNKKLKFVKNNVGNRNNM